MSVHTCLCMQLWNEWNKDAVLVSLWCSGLFQQFAQWILKLSSRVRFPSLTFWSGLAGHSEGSPGRTRVPELHSGRSERAPRCCHHNSSNSSPLPWLKANTVELGEKISDCCWFNSHCCIWLNVNYVCSSQLAAQQLSVYFAGISCCCEHSNKAGVTCHRGRREAPVSP